MREFTVGKEEEGQRLDKFLQRYLPEAGTGFLYKMLRKKNIKLNGRKADGKNILVVGDKIEIYFSDDTFGKFCGKTQFSKAVLDPSFILYEDDEAALINKPAGMLSQKASAADLSVVELFQGYLFQKGEVTEESLRFFSPGVINRLDRNTSGIIIAAKKLHAAQELSRMLKERTFQKYYLALVEGNVEAGDSVSAWLKKDSVNNTVSISDTKKNGYSRIETAYVPLIFSEGYTLLQVELITGKTHQIRSHLSYIGHPLAGDVKYGSTQNKNPNSRELDLKRQFLHAWKVKFPDKMCGLPALEGHTFTAALPEDLLNALDQIGINRQKLQSLDKGIMNEK